MRSSNLESFPFEQLAGMPAQELAREAAAPAGAGMDLAGLEADLAAARAEGYEAGLADARRDLDPAAAALGQALVQAEQERAGAADALEREAAELSLQIAEKVVGGALAVQPERVLEVVRGALRRLVERHTVTILVNPDDLELVREATASLEGALGGIEKLDIQAERRVARGGAILRTVDGELDARIASQLERVRETVESELGG